MPERPDPAITREKGRLATEFRKAYFLVAAMPLLLMLLVVLLGTQTAKHQFEILLDESIDSLNADAEQQLESLGEQLIVTKARDLAREVAVYASEHPQFDIDGLQSDPKFLDIALQTVGKSGYTLVTETETYRIIAHPSVAMMNTNMRRFESDIPTLFTLVERAIHGDEMSGYYDWIEPDGSSRRKFMASSPVPVIIDGKVLNAVATIYVDEFSSPMLSMRRKAEQTRSRYRNYVSRAWAALLLSILAVSVLAILMVRWYGMRTTEFIIDPVQSLARSASDFADGRSAPISLPDISQRGDEIGQLAQSLEQMSLRVNELIDAMSHRLEDLSETQRALEESEEQLRVLFEESNTREKEYRSLLDTSANAIVTFDLSRKVTYVNRAFTEMFGWELEELAGNTLDYLPENEPQAIQNIAGATEEGKSAIGYEGRRLTKDGNWLDVSVSVSRFNDHEDRPAGMLAVIRDVSDKKRLQQRVHHDERLRSLGNLAGGIAHDFNNILMVIQGCTSLIRAESDLSAVYEHLGLMEEQIESASSLTRQLLGYAGKGQYEVKVDNLNRVIRKAAEAVSRTNKTVTFVMRLADNLANIEADFFQLEQVLMNLLLNATDAMPDGGSIEVTTGNDSDRQGVWLEITDTGAGIDPGTLDHIFEPFFTTKAIGRGTGLGLASAQGILEAHHGKIAASSEVGVGTTFRIWLPAVEAAIEIEVQPTANSTSGGGRVLWIDDEDMVLKVSCRMLELLGYEVVGMTDGIEALDYCYDNIGSIDLVMLDMVMPGISSSEVFKVIRAAKPELPVMLVTGYSLEESTDPILSEPLTDFLQKPFGVEVLSEKVAALIEAANKSRVSHPDPDATPLHKA